jgi:metal-sulfur cluster biosynthetic enzyme
VESTVIEVLRTIYDPEIPVDIYELGLIYDVSADGEGNVDIKMTLTSPACPVAGSLPGEVESKIRRGVMLSAAKHLQVITRW